MNILNWWTSIARTLAALLVLVVTITLHSVPLAHEAGCPEGTELFAQYQLFFGRSLGGLEVVSDAAWQRFLSSEITPRFSDGLTVVNASGQWRNTLGEMEQERAKVVIVLAPLEEAGLRSTEEIALAYKDAFAQDAVLRTVNTTCAAF